MSMGEPADTVSSSTNPFVNLAEISLSHDSQPDLILGPMASASTLPSHAVELSSGENSPYVFNGALDYIDDEVTSGWTTPLASCVNCTAWGYQCEAAQEGESQSCCVPCASLGCECSFLDTHPNFLDHAINDLMQSSRTASTEAQGPPTTDVSKKYSGPFEPVTASTTSTPPPPKIGTRFSRDSTRILRQWLSSHNQHPYPSEEEKRILQHQTGLSKVQITNWLINARRRGKVQGRHRSTSPYSGNAETSTGPVNVPRRPGTPAPRSSPRYQSLNPLERWVDSPPEHEPATVTAIARAMASSHANSSGADDSYNTSFIDDEPPRSLYYTSSASSAGNSSGGSFASAYSHASKNSAGIPRPVLRSRARQRRRPKRTSLANPRNQYQCTFCTETFRTKHDWQRHEKSLHMPLERWVCSPNGPRDIDPGTHQTCCVFCGEIDPSPAHIDSHNPSSCQERTFNRKDHLKQHMKLVHNSGLLDWSAKLWKITVPDIRSRCGFCGASLDTWSIRADHLADHFKMGSDMASWKGDWGFEDAVFDMVENSVPPYLIEYERFSPFPYQASGTPPESPRNAYELLTLELNHFLRLFLDRTGNLPNNREIQLEACRIVFASEVSASEGHLGVECESWLRDLITSSEDITREARFGPIRSRTESMMSVLQIKGKYNLFEGCPCEAQLDGFVEARRDSGANDLSNQHLQNEACKIVTRLGKNWGLSPADLIDNWLVNLISSSTRWLSPFRSRKRLSQVEFFVGTSTQPQLLNGERAYTGIQVPLEVPRVQDTSTVSITQASMHDVAVVPFDEESELGKSSTMAIDSPPSFQPANINFRQPASTESVSYHRGHETSRSMDILQPFESPSRHFLPATNMSWHRPGSTESDGRSLPSHLSTVKRNYAFFNDANFHRWLAQELRRWIAATMSPNNPNCHVPSDEEIQHQARFIVYEDGDPWNQTSADNHEWLRRFKKSIGMETQDQLDG
ncbi:Putative Homeobox domain, Zinc finger C2H2-type [Colletotrichum destructivum]|uniref:Homeobox domain, Zinc finger C2H2-type n=1 Tax=Colletotrichum destructivum TaxID=34406 RepID=A0AAX4J093_9PEZI|nr:Putative Homeobox domain, Zinc finger C2H2-type [Colletotrichum destructivum]